MHHARHKREWTHTCCYQVTRVRTGPYTRITAPVTMSSCMFTSTSSSKACMSQMHRSAAGGGAYPPQHGQQGGHHHVSSSRRYACPYSTTATKDGISFEAHAPPQVSPPWDVQIRAPSPTNTCMLPIPWQSLPYVRNGAHACARIRQQVLASLHHVPPTERGAADPGAGIQVWINVQVVSTMWHKRRQTK